MNIVIIGAGASGMAAAIQAARDPEHKIILLERQSRVGKKLMATGNGRCNLTNTGTSPENYHGSDPDFVCSVLDAYPPERVLNFFEELGLLTNEEYGGRVFPRSSHAASVVDVLRLGLQQENVCLRTDTAVDYVVKTDTGFELTLGNEKLQADRLIIACGGCAGTKIGGTMDGYHLLKSLGHSRTALYPALTQIRTAPEYPKAMKGVKVDGGLSLWRGKALLGEARGDILFTESGISGTAVFELSRIAAVLGEDITAKIDFFPEMKENDLYQHLKKRCAALSQQDAALLLTGAVQSRVGQCLMKSAKVCSTSPCSALRDRDLRNLSKAAKCLSLSVTGVSGFESAQVTHGGIKTEEFDPVTLESRLVPGLFACGEVLDVDGDCGGYNLQWAWASGLTAGLLGNHPD